MFKSRLHGVDVPPDLWALEAPLVWDDRSYAPRKDGYPTGFGYVVFPAGTVTDLGSVPHALRFIRAFDPLGPSRRACVGHDFLYAKGKWPDGRIVTRATADEFLRRALIADGVPASVARLWWLGVRVGGWRPWNAYRVADLDTGLN